MFKKNKGRTKTPERSDVPYTIVFFTTLLTGKHRVARMGESIYL